MQERITGFDFARALALLGMILVNFKMAMNAETGSNILLSFTTLLQGRASALFVILAGIGATLISNRARFSDDISLIASTRSNLIRRAVLLIVVGLLFSLIWEGDILVFYGFYFLVAASLFTQKDKTLLVASVAVLLLFPLLLIFFDYEKNWDWSTLTYTDLWSAGGLIRRIFYNGFHPIFPWASFMIFGMWLARKDLANREVRRKLLINSLALLSITEIGCYLLKAIYLNHVANESVTEDIMFLFSTAVMPPLPQYIISAGSSSVIVIIGSLYFCEKFSTLHASNWLCQTGQMTLTLYVSHVIFGMGLLQHVGLLEHQTIDFSVTAALVFYAAAIFFSVFWLKHFSAGPLEYFFRKITKR